MSLSLSKYTPYPITIINMTSPVMEIATTQTATFLIESTVFIDLYHFRSIFSQAYVSKSIVLTLSAIFTSVSLGSGAVMQKMMS